MPTAHAEHELRAVRFVASVAAESPGRIRLGKRNEREVPINRDCARAVTLSTLSVAKLSRHRLSQIVAGQVRPAPRHHRLHRAVHQPKHAHMGENTAQTRERSGHWRKGYCPNPGGRPKAALDIQALARSHGPEAIKTLVHCLRDDRYKLAAAIALLDRGFGKPAVSIHTQSEAVMLHLVAATEVGNALIEAVNDAPQIDGSAAAHD
jgi:hypothetical protein